MYVHVCYAMLNVNTCVFVGDVYLADMLLDLVSCLSGRRLTEDALYCAGECELLGNYNQCG